MRKVVVALVLMAPSLFGCNCSGNSLEIKNHILPPESSLNFGSVFVNEHTQQQLELSLDGRSSTPLQIKDGTVPDGFSVDLGNSTVLQPGQHLKVTITFAPTSLGEIKGDVIIQASNTAEKQAVIHLTGAGKKQDIQTDPNELDFGVVRVGNLKKLPMVVSNLIDSPQTVHIVSDDPTFSIEPDAIDLAPLGAQTISVTFRPTTRGEFDGPHLHFTLCSSCDEVRRKVKGVGAIEDFTLSPTPLDFGTHSPGSTACQDVTIRNTGDVAIKFSSVIPDPYFVASHAFDLQIGNLLDGTTQLDPTKTTTITVCFTPKAIAKDYNGAINFLTLDNYPAKLNVHGRGGSAQIVCVPDHMDFGVSTPSSPVTKQVVCKNLGEPEDVNLRTISVNQPDTLRLDYSQDGEPMGFNVGRADFHLSATFTASVPGDYAPTITLTFGRPGVPTDDILTIPVTGTIVDGVPCTLSVRPSTVNFGLVNYAATYTRDVLIVNTNPTSQCFVWEFAMDPMGSDKYTVTGTPNAITAIPAGGSLALTVVYDPKSQASITLDEQTLSFKQVTGSGMDPTVKVPISGFASQLDLRVSPNPIDFGSIPIPLVKHLSVNLTNANERLIKVGGNMPPGNPAGDIATSVDSSPAFGIANVPTRLPYTVPGKGVMTFTAVFAPTSPGDYTGSLEIWLLNAAAPIIVPIIGNANNGPCDDCGKPQANCPAAQATWVNAAVQLTGSGYDQTDPTTVTCHWDVVDAPTTSVAIPEQPDQCISNFRPDVEGTYNFRLTVKNSQGKTDTCNAQVIAKTFLGMWIETTWGAPDDIDLHLFHPSAGDVLQANTWFSLPYDCYYSNQNPYWDTLGRADDPSLDRDDEVGQGPENIRIDSPVDAAAHSYEIGVHWFAARNRNKSQTVTTRVYCAGKQRAELTSVLTRQYMAADVGKVLWDSSINDCTVKKGLNFTLTVIP